MKTLREYIDQLDEISRRGFLKGAGVAAVAGAAGGANASQTRNRIAYLTGFLSHFGYWIESLKGKDEWIKYLQVYKKSSSTREEHNFFFEGQDDGKRVAENNRAAFDSIMAKYGKGPMGEFNPQRVLKARELDAELNELVNEHWTEFKKLTRGQFESVEQGVAEEASPDALAKIDQVYQK